MTDKADPDLYATILDSKIGADIAIAIEDHGVTPRKVFGLLLGHAVTMLRLETGGDNEAGHSTGNNP